MCRIFFYFLLTLVGIVIAKTDDKYRYDYIFNKEAKGWLKLHIVPVTFREAFLRCNFEGAVLASPLDERIQKAMVMKQEASNVECGIHTGIHATISKGDFTSIDGVPLAKIPVTWAPNEPDNFGDEEDCIIMLRNGTVADTRCNETLPYVCYKEKTTAPVISVCGTVDSEYNLDARTGNCYKFHTMGKTWRRAQMTCLAEGGYLAVINSAAEAQLLKELFAKYPASSIMSKYKDNVCLGFLDRDQKGSWFTVNGQSLKDAGYTSWSEGQPDNAKSFDGGQHCGSMFRTGLLDDVWCESVPFAFICEITTDQEHVPSLATNFIKENKVNYNRMPRHCLTYDRVGNCVIF